MTTATLNHPNFSAISFPITGESGDPLVSRDFGKPHLDFYESGRLDPLAQSDQWSMLVNYTIATQLTGTNAYQDALNLADMIKSPSAGSALTFNPSSPNFDTDISTVPQAEQDQALTLTYPPGTRDWVEVDLGLTRVGPIQGVDIGLQASAPRASGDGPVTIRDSNEAVTLGTDLEVTRSVGRPNSSVKRNIGTYPRYIERPKAAYDAFSLELQTTSDTTATIDTLKSLFETRRGRNTLTLDFKGVFGMGAFSVMPSGSGAVRFVEPAGQRHDEWVTVPTIDLRVVSDD